MKPKFLENFHAPAQDGETIETEPDANGVFFRATIIRDEDMREPWEEHDGQGIIRKASTYAKGDKAPGERLLYRGERNEYTYFYDWSATIKLAKKDGWGCAKHTHATRGEEIVCSVQQNFDYLEGWLNERWFWVGVSVQGFKPCEMGETHEISHASLWGIDSLNEGNYLTSVANDLLDETLDEVTEKEAVK